MGMDMGVGMCICMVGYVYVYVYVYVREYVHVYVYVWSANLSGQNLGKSGNHGSGIEETFFNKMRGAIFRHCPRNFQERLRKKVRNGRGGGDYECTCIYILHGVLKCTAIFFFLCHWMIFTFAEGKGKGSGFGVWGLGF